MFGDSYNIDFVKLSINQNVKIAKKMTEYKIPEEPNNFKNFIIPILLMVIISSILYFGDFHKMVDDRQYDYIVSVRVENLFVLEKLVSRIFHRKMKVLIENEDLICSLES